MAIVLDEVCKLLPRNPKILDFGAGKLRNTIYLLNKGYSISAVEFEKTRNSPKAKKMYSEALAFKSKFKPLIFPHEFFESEIRYDLILLLNVCNIMPVPSERLLVIQYCRSSGGIISKDEPHLKQEASKLC